MAEGDTPTNYDPDLNDRIAQAIQTARGNEAPTAVAAPAGLPLDLSGRIEQAIRGQMVDMSNPLYQIGMAVQKFGAAAGRQPDPEIAFVNRQLQLQQAMQQLSLQRMDRTEKHMGLLVKIGGLKIPADAKLGLLQQAADSSGIPTSPALIKALGSTEDSSLAPLFQEVLDQANPLETKALTALMQSGDLEKATKAAKITADRILTRSATALMQANPGMNETEARRQAVRESPGLSALVTVPPAPELTAQQGEEKNARALLTGVYDKVKALPPEQQQFMIASLGLDPSKFIGLALTGPEAAARVQGTALGQITPVAPGKPTPQAIEIGTAGAKAGAEAFARPVAEARALRQPGVATTLAQVEGMKAGARTAAEEAAAPSRHYGPAENVQIKALGFDPNTAPPEVVARALAMNEERLRERVKLGKEMSPALIDKFIGGSSMKDALNDVRDIMLRRPDLVGPLKGHLDRWVRLPLGQGDDDTVRLHSALSVLRDDKTHELAGAQTSWQEVKRMISPITGELPVVGNPANVFKARFDLLNRKVDRQLGTYEETYGLKYKPMGIAPWPTLRTMLDPKTGKYVTEKVGK